MVLGGDYDLFPPKRLIGKSQKNRFAFDPYPFGLLYTFTAFAILKKRYAIMFPRKKGVNPLTAKLFKSEFSPT